MAAEEQAHPDLPAALASQTGMPRGRWVAKSSRIESVLKDYAALQHLQALVDAGCKRNEVLSLLDLAFWTDESWKQLVEMDLPRFKREIRQIRHCGDIIDRLNCSDLIYHASIEIQLPQFVELHKSRTLPEQLREYADALDSLRRVFGPKPKPRRHAWKAWIVAVVTEDTKALHDLEVSSLIGAVLDDPEHTEKAHQKWRLDHADLIELMRNEVIQRRRKKGLLSIRN
jgi:hypothetical protein